MYLIFNLAMPQKAEVDKEKSNKGCPRIVSHLSSSVVKDGDKDITLKCGIKGYLFIYFIQY